MEFTLNDNTFFTLNKKKKYRHKKKLIPLASGVILKNKIVYLLVCADTQLNIYFKIHKTMKKRFLAYLFFLLMALASCSRHSEKSQAISIIPMPAEMETTNGLFKLTEETTIFLTSDQPEILRIAELLVEKYRNVSGITLNTEIVKAEQLPKNGIIFSSDITDEELGEEGYQLSVSKDQIIAKAPTIHGLFYAYQTICQLLPAEIEANSVQNNVDWSIPCVEIRDSPRYKWRGLHLDVGRHMMPVEFIKKYIDNMAMHKLNTFHWHLTEDQGWRIEIKKYPKLTEVGAWRKETVIGHARQKNAQYDGKPYGGFYTQEEIKEVVKYAKDRFITVVPEIELPGHSTAAIAAYPKLGVTGKQPEVTTTWGVFPDIYNVDDATFSFLEDVLTEVMDLFPSKYIHIGGDEAPKDQWKASAKIQKQIKKLGLKNEHELQSYFITRIEKFLNSKGRQIIGWDEILEGGLAPNAAVMSWRGEAGGIEAAKSKHLVVMTPGSHVYFDHYQGNPEFEPLAIGGFTTLEKVYSYEPTPSELTAEESQYIMGAQANVWTEYMKTPEKVEYMVFPRLSALSEVLWSPKEKRNWADFKTRMPKQLSRYDERGINYSKSIFKPDYKLQNDSATNTQQVMIHTQWGEGDLFYTTNGEQPSPAAKKYENPLPLDSCMTIKAGLFQDGKLMDEIIEKRFCPTIN